ncbi:MAG: SRPBCC domain-containing protein [Saprospiraceae bacterium]|nr:SRPBCC domain-containing protein [Candidatus Opimibacter skivensis]
MKEAMIVQNTITINAPIERVWKALVDPEMTRIYMYGCEALSDWKPGSLLLWEGEYEGKKMVFVKGYVTAIDPPHLLRYTVFDPNSTMEDIPENYLIVTYRLEESSGKTTLTVTQDGFETATRGEERYIEVSNKGEGWNPILEAIANLLENP